MTVSVFFSYSHKDEVLRDQVEVQLTMLKRQGVIETWHDRRIRAGEEFDGVIDHHINTDEVILLLVSPDFLASDYCYDIEMKRAMERHKAGEAIVIPVILRPCDWHGAPFGKLNATPLDGKPVTTYADRDAAFLEVAKAVREAVGRRAPGATKPNAAQSRTVPGPHRLDAAPRSSNLALAKSFTDRDKDRFRRDTFDFIARFFESSLSELADRNEGIEGEFRQIDADRFTAAIYRHGKAVSQCSVFMGHRSLGGIAYSTESNAGTGFNEHLSVGADDQSMFLKPMGMAATISGRDGTKLTQEGAAELYWGMLIERLQGRR